MMKQRTICDKCGNKREIGKRCKFCKRKWMCAYYKRNRTAILKKANDRFDSVRKNRIESLYGIPYTEYERLLIEQNGVCKICKQPRGKRALAIDHDHETNKIRGLLCGNCNSGIGLLKDDAEIVQAAADYLRSFGTEVAT